MFIQIGRLITLRDTGRTIELKLWFLLKLESNYGNFCNATCCGLQKGCLATAPCPVFVYIGIAMERTHDAGLCCLVSRRHMACVAFAWNHSIRD